MFGCCSCSKVKKAVVLTTLVTGIGIAIFGKDIGSYVRAARDAAEVAVKDQVPVPFELDRARDMVAQLVEEIHAGKISVAEEQTELEGLLTELQGERDAIEGLRQEVASLRKEIEQDESVSTKLRQKFERLKTAEASLAKRERLMETRSQTLETAQGRLEEMLTTKQDLEVEIESLAARMRTIEVSQAESEYQFDDSQLSKAQELLKEVKARIDAEVRLLEVEDEVKAIENELDVEVNDAELGKAIDKYFGESSEESKPVGSVL